MATDGTDFTDGKNQDLIGRVNLWLSSVGAASVFLICEIGAICGPTSSSIFSFSSFIVPTLPWCFLKNETYRSVDTIFLPWLKTWVFSHLTQCLQAFRDFKKTGFFASMKKLFVLQTLREVVRAQHTLGFPLPHAAF